MSAFLTDAALQERFNLKGGYAVAYRSGLPKRAEGSLFTGPYWEYFVPPVVIPGLIIAAIVIVALYRWL
jgi:hypothetical protein